MLRQKLEEIVMKQDLQETKILAHAVMRTLNEKEVDAVSGAGDNPSNPGDFTLAPTVEGAEDCDDSL